jgi:hypothetical protein
MNTNVGRQRIIYVERHVELDTTRYPLFNVRVNVITRTFYYLHVFASIGIPTSIARMADYSTTRHRSTSLDTPPSPPTASNPHNTRMTYLLRVSLMATSTHPHTTVTTAPVITAPPPYSSTFLLRSQSSFV